MFSTFKKSIKYSQELINRLAEKRSTTKNQKVEKLNRTKMFLKISQNSQKKTCVRVSGTDVFL